MNNTRRLAWFVFLGLVGIVSSLTEAQAGRRCRRVCECPSPETPVAFQKVLALTAPTGLVFKGTAYGTDGNAILGDKAVTITVTDLAGNQLASGYTTANGAYSSANTAPYWVWNTVNAWPTNYLVYIKFQRGTGFQVTMEVAAGINMVENISPVVP